MEPSRSHFEELLQQLRVEHDREVLRLQLQVEWLREAAAARAHSTPDGPREILTPLMEADGYCTMETSRHSAGMVRNLPPAAATPFSPRCLENCEDSQAGSPQRERTADMSEVSSVEAVGQWVKESLPVDWQEYGTSLWNTNHLLNTTLAQGNWLEPMPEDLRSEGHQSKSMSVASTSKERNYEKWKVFVDWAYGRLAVQNGMLAEVDYEWKEKSERKEMQAKFRVQPTKILAPGASTKNIKKESSIGTRVAVASPYKMMKDLMIHPNSRIRGAWDMAGMAIVAHDLIAMPLTVFEEGTQGFNSSYQNFLDNVDIASTFFWTFDIIVSFMTGYFSPEGYIELAPKKVAMHYMRSWLLMDVFIVSVDWTNFIMQRQSEENTDGTNKTSSYMRIAKSFSRVKRIISLLRFMKLNTGMKALLDKINSEYVLTGLNLFRIVIVILLINHYVACAWYGLSRSVSDRETWATKFLEEAESEKNASMSYAYSTSLHWSLTQFTPASMEVVPQNAYERFFNVVVIILGFVVFSSFVSSITGAMTHIRHINAQKTAQDSQLRLFFSENRISHELASQVLRYLRRHAMAKGRRLKEADVPALHLLPERLQKMLREEMFSPIFMKHPLLELLSEIDGEAFHNMCVRASGETSLMPGQELYGPSMQVNRMVFVLQGKLEYHCAEDLKRAFRPMPSSDLVKMQTSERSMVENRVALAHAGHDETIFLEVTAGEWVCEAALWVSKARLNGPLVAFSGGCELATISAREFRDCMMMSSTCRRFLVQYAAHFVEEFNNTAANEVPTLASFDDADLVADHLSSWQMSATLGKYRAAATGKNSMKTKLKRMQANAILFNSSENAEELVAQTSKTLGFSMNNSRESLLAGWLGGMARSRASRVSFRRSRMSAADVRRRGSAAIADYVRHLSQADYAKDLSMQVTGSLTGGSSEVGQRSSTSGLGNAAYSRSTMRSSANSSVDRVISDGARKSRQGGVRFGSCAGGVDSVTLVLEDAHHNARNAVKNARASHTGGQQTFV